MSDGDEFALIAKHFAPLARDPAARGLLDDVAFVEGHGPFIVTTDTIVEGVHFLPSDPIDTIAKKCLRVNVSDVVAKGFAPSHYLLSLQWPKHRPAAQIEHFAAGLAKDQATFGCTLIGGDTTGTPGPLAINVTMFGRPLSATPPQRSGAQVGDDVWVTGFIGDGVLGLRALTDGLALDAAQVAYLVGCYRTPRPRLAIAATVAAFASASMDVSDGLLGDAAKIASASGVRLVLEPDLVPLSAAAADWLTMQPDRDTARTALFNGGDDYEILFTAPSARRARLLEAADDAGVALTRIGAVVAGQGVGAGGLPIGGHVHRLGT
jgi:thiamine-monophosphate kinase